MQPIVISGTIQEFHGKRYYLCGRYFQKRGARLHRLVWEKANGPVPDGHHVHHIDNDRSHNWLGNLECLPASIHLSDRHGGESSDRGRATIYKAIASAPLWHRSEEGRAWHKLHYEQDIRQGAMVRIDATCQHCGKEYSVNKNQKQRGKWCGNNCKSRALRKRRAIARTAARLLPDRAEQ